MPGRVPCEVGCECRKHLQKGQPKSAETRERMRQAHLGKPLSSAHLAARTLGQRGKPKSDAYKRAVSEAMKGNKNGSKTMYCGTWPEQVMAALLDYAGVEYEVQKWFGRANVDFYLPIPNVVIEVDGVHWHPNGPDEQRDSMLLAQGVSAVVHITDEDLAGWNTRRTQETTK